MGVEFWRRECVPRDYGKAAAFWKQASDQGDLHAKNDLAYVYYHGLDGSPRYEEAIALWREAAAFGVYESRIHLANAQLDGEHLPVSPMEASAWAQATLYCAAQDHSVVHVQMAQETLASAEDRLSTVEPPRRILGPLGLLFEGTRWFIVKLFVIRP